jgi:outer membrane cobalamin receptor
MGTNTGRIFQLLWLSFSMHTLCAQTGGIEGRITDAETKIPVSGVSIQLPVIKKGNNTDDFGSFRFNSLAAGRYELITTYTGYKTEVIPVEVRDNAITMVSIALKKSVVDLSEVRLTSKIFNGLNAVGQADILLRPANQSQDLLRIVPGLFIAQHAGGGKAEQIFLRGFDIDHGTDINLTTDGIPVNMVSHAHGQGYADLHFVIPETIEKITFESGPFRTEKGNLATAGSVDFKTKDFLSKNQLKAEAGDFSSQRISGQIIVLNKGNTRTRQQLYTAAEYARTDGYFESPQNFHRLNLFAKYNRWTNEQTQFSMQASFFDSKWNASGQVPDRAIRSGLISRFGSIDDTEGGNTGRFNVSARLSKKYKSGWQLTDQVYFSRYHFSLFSNFTFFLEDPVNGDEIRQRESRSLYGLTKTATHTGRLGNKKTQTELGTGLRTDRIGNLGLTKAVRRNLLAPVQQGDVREHNLYLYWNQQLELGSRLTMEGGLRFDYFSFGYRNQLTGESAFRRQSRGVLSPKLQITYSPSDKVQLFLKNGIGFHSNDSRVILDQQANEILPKVTGTDLGIQLKPVKRMILKTTLWYLFSEQEFVYVGDAGIVEPGGRSERMGLELSIRYQLSNWLWSDIDLNLTRARALNVPKEEDFIPLAPSFTSTGGLTAKLKNGFSTALRYRYIDDRPANEDNSVTAIGYFLTDLRAEMKIKSVDLFISVENLWNSQWNEAQFSTTSQLKNEPAPVTELHFTPGTPRYFKTGVVFNF